MESNLIQFPQGNQISQDQSLCIIQNLTSADTFSQENEQHFDYKINEILLKLNSLLSTSGSNWASHLDELKYYLQQKLIILENEKKKSILFETKVAQYSQSESEMKSALLTKEKEFEELNLNYHKKIKDLINENYKLKGENILLEQQSPILINEIEHLQSVITAKNNEIQGLVTKISTFNDCTEKFEYLNTVYTKIFSSKQLIESENDILRLDYKKIHDKYFEEKVKHNLKVGELNKTIFDLQSIISDFKLKVEILNSKLISFENENIILKSQVKDKETIENSCKKIIETSQIERNEFKHASEVNEELNKLYAKESNNFLEKAKIFSSELEKEKVIKAEAEFQFHQLKNEFLIEKCKVISIESLNSINSELMVETLKHEVAELNFQKADLESRITDIIKQCEEKTTQLGLQQLKNEENMKIIGNLKNEVSKFSSLTNRDKCNPIKDNPKREIVNYIKNHPLSYKMAKLISFPDEKHIKIGFKLFDILYDNKSLILKSSDEEQKYEQIIDKYLKTEGK